MAHALDAEPEALQTEPLAVLKLKWDHLLLDGSTYIDIPPGWMQLLEDLFIELTAIDGKVEVYSLTELWGELESEIVVTPVEGGEFRAYQIKERYRLRSHGTCIECGEMGTRQVVNSKVYVLCRECEENIRHPKKPTDKTGTWLDQF